MIIVCPVCSSEYDFDESFLGKKVSCECGCSWILTDRQVRTDTSTTDTSIYIYPTDDPIFRQAFKIIVEEQRASASFLQRELGIGYNSASDILMEFERRGIVSAPREGGSKRKVLVSAENTTECDLDSDEVCVSVQDDLSYFLPPVNLLNESFESLDEDPDRINIYKDKLESIFNGFDISIKIIRVDIGAQFIRFVIQPSKGTLIQDILSIQRNLEVSFGIEKLRLIIPIPNEAFIGVEIPRKMPEIVSLYSLVSSKNWIDQTISNKIPLLIGQNIYRECVVLDLIAASHIFVFGSNSENCCNFLDNAILSILLKFPPEKLKMILVDFNRISFSMYNQLPHLATPVVHDPSNCRAVFEWVTKEIDLRLSIIKSNHVKDIFGIWDKQRDCFPIIYDNDDFYNKNHNLSPIVIFVNEVFYLYNDNDFCSYVDEVIRIGHKTGIYLVASSSLFNDENEILSKFSNIPVKVAFYSKDNSDIIKNDFNNIDTRNLLPNGDLFLLDNNQQKENRIQIAHIDITEQQRIIDFVCVQRPQNYIVNNQAELDFVKKEIQDLEDTKDQQKDKKNSFGISSYFSTEVEKYIYSTDDEIFQKAFKIIFEEKRATPSYLQRRLGIEYSLASDILTEFERRRILSPPDERGHRDILIFVESKSNTKIDNVESNFLLESVSSSWIDLSTDKLYAFFVANKKISQINFNLILCGYCTAESVKIFKERGIIHLISRREKLYLIKRIPDKKEIYEILKCAREQKNKITSLKLICENPFYILVLLVIIGGIIAFGFAIYDSTYSETSKKIRQYELAYGKEDRVISIAKSKIRQNLKVPSSASFPGNNIAKLDYNIPDILVKNAKRPVKAIWKVYIPVEAQNSFGVKIRSNYYIVVVFWGDDNYEAIHIEELL